ncbi:TetR/AcrR family transcriptional regulator [Crossiella sp. CA-258035]|uniref:TetR/AcrR family transcriptional regulator n=1 Tax=Crossiella sp. CA-258035 TaxID=2981138 RepID=UPI0024BBFC04|nr:TetR/AcrR family transcriptional regulator [Crossiella sp. CA-258035]WHT21683.1 TetR/AcrR family transcriptional regulator [Crossiella sp. CA-258035]
MPADDPAPTRRLPRAQRREQILVAATEALSRNGFAATSLDDLAAEAGVSRMILYRHFESKQDLCHAVLDRATSRLLAATEVEVGAASVQALVTWAAAEPAAFRVLFQHAAHQPEYAAQAQRLRSAMAAEVLTRLAGQDPWTRWAARLATTTCLEAITAWLDVGAPDPDSAVGRITAVIESIVAG